MGKVMYFLSPKENMVGMKNACRKKPLKRCATVQVIANSCKNTPLKDSIVKMYDLKTHCLSNKRGKKYTVPTSPLLTESEKQKVKRGKSWLMPSPYESSDTETEELYFTSDDDSSSDFSSLSSDNEKEEFIFF